MSELEGLAAIQKSYFDSSIDAGRTISDTRSAFLAELKPWLDSASESEILAFIGSAANLRDEGLVLRFHPSPAVQMALVQAGRKNSVWTLVHLFTASEHAEVRAAAFKAFQQWVAMEEPSQQAYLMSELGQTFL